MSRVQNSGDEDSGIHGEADQRPSTPEVVGNDADSAVRACRNESMPKVLLIEDDKVTAD